MAKTPSLTARVSLLISLLTALLLGAGASVALAAASAKTHSGKTPKHAVTTARKHKKHTVKKVPAKKTVFTATAAKAVAPARKKPTRPTPTKPTTPTTTTKTPTTTTPTTTTKTPTTTTPTTKTPTTTTPTTTTPTTTTPTTTTPTTTTPTTTTPTTTTPTTTTPTPTPTSGLAACTTSAPADAQPTGQSGSWTPVFDDEFNGTSVNTTLWSTDNGYTNQNNVTDSSSNITVADGCAALTLASSTSGAQMVTNTAGLLVGDFAEARIQFAGSSSTVDNWPAFWSAGAGWPASGEQDIFEGLGRATINYHYAVNGNNTQAGPFNIAGNWAGSFHTYGIYRGSNYCDVYWDGQLVKTYPTSDTGTIENLLLTEGAANTLSFGASGQMLVDYVRVWKQS
jgi:Glycosyl hydrolases family 16